MKVISLLKFALIATFAIASAAEASQLYFRVFAPGARLSTFGQLVNPNPDFGAITDGSSQSRTFTLKNTSTSVVTGVYALVTARPGLGISANNCGTQSVPGSLAPGATCDVTLTYGGSTDSTLAGANLIFGASLKSSVSVGLTGSIVAVQQPVTAAQPVAQWMNTVQVGEDPNALLFGHQKSTQLFGIRNPVGGTYDQWIFVKNVGTGAQSLGYVLTGTTTQFNIADVMLYDDNGSYPCLAGGTFSPDRTAMSPCLAGDVAFGKSYVGIHVQYVPKAAGNHGITINLTTDNGTALPDPVYFSGSAR